MSPTIVHKGTLALGSYDTASASAVLTVPDHQQQHASRELTQLYEVHDDTTRLTMLVWPMKPDVFEDAVPSGVSSRVETFYV